MFDITKTNAYKIHFHKVMEMLKLAHKIHNGKYQNEPMDAWNASIAAVALAENDLKKKP